MIFPFLNGIAHWTKAPATWLLLCLNLLGFAWLQPLQDRGKKEVEKLLGQEEFMRAQGLAFAQFVDGHPGEYSQVVADLAGMALAGKDEKFEILGRLALRDQNFIENGADVEYSGDQVLMDFWKTKFVELMELQDRDPHFVWGLSPRHLKPWNWITYQFVHGGWVHLLGNMWFLMIFGCFLEPLLGSLALGVLYLTSGILAASIFVWASGAASVPLVGASGAVSGLMGLFTVLSWKRPVRFLYWLLPVKGYQGFVFLPTWMALVVWLISDLAGYISTLQEMGGIAHTAHLGGFAVGLSAGVLLVWVRDRWISPPQIHA